MGKLRCKVCGGILYQQWDAGKMRQDYYKATLRCLTCGRDFEKIELIKELRDGQKKRK